MSEVAQGQAEAPSAPAFHVALSEGDAAPAEPRATQTATEAGDESSESTDANAEITAEEADPNDSEALRKKYNAQYSRKLEAERKLIREQVLAEMKGKVPEPEPDKPAERATEDTSDDPIAAVYKVDTESLKLAPTKLPEDHQLYGFESDLDTIIDQRVDQKVQRVLDRIYQNDQQFRQQMVQAERQAVTGKVIQDFVADVKDHPDLQLDEQGRLNETGQKFVELAQRYAVLKDTDPEAYLELIESKSGIARGWRGDRTAAQQAAGQQNQRLANKPGAIVSKPTRVSGAPQPKPGSMTLKESLDMRMKALRG